MTIIPAIITNFLLSLESSCFSLMFNYLAVLNFWYLEGKKILKEKKISITFGGILWSLSGQVWLAFVWVIDWKCYLNSVTFLVQCTFLDGQVICTSFIHTCEIYLPTTYVVVGSVHPSLHSALQPHFHSIGELCGPPDHLQPGGPCQCTTAESWGSGS